MTEKIANHSKPIWQQTDNPHRVWVLPGVIGIVICCDWLFWRSHLGLNFVVWILLMAAAIQVTLWPVHDLKKAKWAWGVLAISLIPAVDVMQFTSAVFGLAGLTFFALFTAAPNRPIGHLARAAKRLPGVGIMQILRDIVRIGDAIPQWPSLRDWIIPTGIGMIFLTLLLGANPVLDQWRQSLGQHFGTVTLSDERLFFWIVCALAIWPMLRLSSMAARLFAPVRPRKWQLRMNILNPRSVTRALVLFNLIFALQSVLDAGYLWGGIALPDGMSYADYAHRGAYPLLAVALLAGLFAVLAQPFLDARPALRFLMYLWIGQTFLLVISSILRLDLYIDAYGLTRLRFAAFVWMGLVAAGLLLLVTQMIKRHPISWFWLSATALTAAVLYVCALINVDGVIARHNLAQDKIDRYYLCRLGDGAKPAIHAHDPELCGTRVSTPTDWREWGYRNARLRHNLNAQMTEAQP